MQVFSSHTGNGGTAGDGCSGTSCLDSKLSMADWRGSWAWDSNIEGSFTVFHQKSMKGHGSGHFQGDVGHSWQISEAGAGLVEDASGVSCADLASSEHHCGPECHRHDASSLWLINSLSLVVLSLYEPLDLP